MSKYIAVALDKLFIEEPEQLVAGQQRETYHNGYKTDNPNRKQVREPYTREEIEAKHDQYILGLAKQWGDDYIYTRWARESKEKDLQDYDEGKVIAVYIEEYHKDGMDYADTHYSDGTVSTTSYGYSD